MFMSFQLCEERFTYVQQPRDPPDYHWENEMSDCPDDDCAHDVLPFHLCDLAHGWTKSSEFPALPRQSARRVAIDAHRLLFTYVVGEHATFEEEFQIKSLDPSVVNVPMMLRVIADCVELARYYDLADVVSAPLAHDLKQTKSVYCYHAWVLHDARREAAGSGDLPRGSPSLPRASVP